MAKATTKVNTPRRTPPPRARATPPPVARVITANSTRAMAPAIRLPVTDVFIRIKDPPRLVGVQGRPASREPARFGPGDRSAGGRAAAAGRRGGPGPLF